MRRPRQGKKRDHAPRVRAGTVRVSSEVARRIRDGHPWIFKDALQGRTLSVPEGRAVDVLDQNGNFLARALHDPTAGVPLRVFSHRRETAFDADFIRGAVGRAAARRRRWLDIGPLACIRVLSGDCEGIPTVNVDLYADYLVAIAYSALAEGFIEPLLDALVESWSPRGVYLQRRYQPTGSGKARPGAELCRGAAAPPEVVVSEGRVRFVVDVTAPLGTGLFADMRLGRRAVAELAGGRRVVNCFSYTGAFSVVAAAHGATEVVSVDAASRAHGRARRNFSVNKIAIDGPGFSFVTGDTFATLHRMYERGQRYDLAIVDPPTFSTTGKGRPFTAQKDYAELVEAAVKVLDPGGVLCAASNAARLAPSELERAIARGAAQAKRGALITQRLGQPPDYPAIPGFSEASYLKFFVVQL